MLTNREKKINPLYVAILICLFCATLDVLNKYYYFVYIAFVVFLLVYDKIILDKSTVLLLVYAISLVCFAPMFQVSLISVFKPFVFPLMYILGYGICVKHAANAPVDSKRYNSLITIIIVLGLGGLAHYLLNWSINFNAIERNTIDFWTGETSAATNQAAMAAISIGVSIAVLVMKTKIRYKIIAAIVLFLVFTYNLVLAGRTIVLMMLFIFVFAMVYNVRGNTNKKTKLLLRLIAIIGLIFLIYQLDLFGVRSFVEDSLLYNRFFGESSIDATQDTRFEHKLIYLSKILDYPFGGTNLRGMYGFSHDLFFDSYDEAGWVAFVSITAYVVVASKRWIKVIKNKNIPFSLRMILLCIFVAIFIEFWVEPVLQASAWLLMAFCVIDGSLKGVIAMENKLNKQIKEN